MGPMLLGEWLLSPRGPGPTPTGTTERGFWGESRIADTSVIPGEAVGDGDDSAAERTVIYEYCTMRRKNNGTHIAASGENGGGCREAARN